ncbi:MAG: DUF1819 family protein [Candidatus Theseobacter exili]|nr:DUF1819 family protein [Candidatus Theseobacter exili]
MNINTDINVLGSILDLNIISAFLNTGADNATGNVSSNNNLSNTKIKTTKSLKRYENAIKNTLVFFKDNEIKELFETVYAKEGLSDDCLLILFLNASFNNHLLDYFNQNIFFPAFFSGRIAIKKDEIIACINDLKNTEEAVMKWSESTSDIMASKYLALLKKFHLLEGGRNKSIKHKYIDDKQFVLFIYWLLKTDNKPNILENKWLPYCLLDKDTFMKRVLQKKFMKYLNVVYTGNTMKLEPLISYKDVYNELTQS